MTAQQSVDTAVETGEAMLTRKFGEASIAQDHTQYLSQLQVAGVSLLDELPGDLFFPSSKPFRDRRTIALPDGGTGEFEVRWEATAAPVTGHLQTARREVITRIGTNERRSFEDWTLRER